MKNDLLVNEEFGKYDGGVYGIFLCDKCIYVGSTHNFGDRIAQHNQYIAEESSRNPKGLYKYLGSGFAPAAEFRVLVSIKDLQLHCKYVTNIDEKAIDAIELAFIRWFKPQYNTKGRDMLFTFDHWDKDKENWREF